MTIRSPRPTLCIVVGEPGAGKRTLIRGLADIFGPERCTILALDDYALPTGARSPEASGATAAADEPGRADVAGLALMAQHLRLLRQGETIFKPVLADDGRAAAPEFVRPTPIILAHGRHGLETPELRALWDVSVQLDTAPSDAADGALRHRADLLVVAPSRDDAAPRYTLRLAHPVALPALDGLRGSAVLAALDLADATAGIASVGIPLDLDDVTAARLEAEVLDALPSAPSRRALRLGLRRDAAPDAPCDTALALTQLLVAHYLVQRGVPAVASPALSPEAVRSAHPAPGA